MVIVIRYFIFRSIVQFYCEPRPWLIKFYLKTVPLQIGELTRDILESRGYPVTFKVYNGLEHLVSSEEIQDMISFLQQVIPEQNSK